MKPQLKRLLFVDDEANIRKTLPLILRRYGFTVTVCATVAEALEEIQSHEFDVLLCDLNIEREGDGYELVRAVREVNPRCVTIVLTGYPGLESAVEGIHLGIDDYIVKPTNADALVALLAEKLDQRRPKARVFLVSYDESLLQTWRMLLEAKGYDVVSSLGNAGLEKCKSGKFDVFLLGPSVPEAEKRVVIEKFHNSCPAPVVSIRANPEEQPVGAEYHIDSDPQVVLKTIAQAISGKPAAADTTQRSANSTIM